ncbi:MAG: hypothetical protein Q4A98_11360 [Comamonadaceae bacterium]|nr:hypothetical protein [Comamonadaceae bacterium]
MPAAPMPQHIPAAKPLALNRALALAAAAWPWLMTLTPWLVAAVCGGVSGGWEGVLEAPLGIALAPWFFVSIYVTFLDTYPVWAVVFFPLLYLAAFASMVAGIKCWSRWWGKVLLGWSYFALGWMCALQILAVT